MSQLESFARYADDFEKAFETEDWSIVEPHFEPDAVYEIIGEPPLAGLHQGRAAVMAHLQNSVDTFDRSFDSRTLDILEGPEERDSGVWLRWRATYGVAGAPDFVMEGEEAVWFEGDRITRLEDRYPEGVGAAVLGYMGEHGAKLHPVNRGE
jgi:hypothetical protein